MKNYVERWMEQLNGRPRVTMDRNYEIEITGERNAHLGPRMEYAMVRAVVEPSEIFTVIDEVKIDKELKNSNILISLYVEYWIF